MKIGLVPLIIRILFGVMNMVNISILYVMMMMMFSIILIVIVIIVIVMIGMMISILRRGKIQESKVMIMMMMS